MSKKKLKKALGLGLGVMAAKSFMGAKSKAANKLLQTDTGDFGNQMDNDTNLVRGTAKSLLKKKKIPMKKPSSMNNMNYGSAFGLEPMDAAKKGKMIKAKGGKEIRFKKTKLY